MALILGRRVGEVIYAETSEGATVTLTLLSHRHNGINKVALVRADFEDGSSKELEIKSGHEPLTVQDTPYIGIAMETAGRNGVRIACHGARDAVTFLRKEVKERKNG